ncbi:MAG: molybdopterin oxidoreductase family protein [Armatimonadota bacterium]
MVAKPTICGFCSCGCALYVQCQNGRVAGVLPSNHHPVSQGRLCIKGWYGTPSVLGPGRLTTPLIRRDGRLVPCSWDEALSVTADALRTAVSTRGPWSVGVIGSAKTTNEESYSLVKLARKVIGTPNVDGACRFYDASLIPGLLGTIGTPFSQIELADISSAQSILIVGANVTEQLPMVGTRVAEASRSGCKVVVIDPRVPRVAAFARKVIQPRPGTDFALLCALLRTIIDCGLYVNGAQNIAGFQDLYRSLHDVSVSQACEECGVDVTVVSDLAELLAANHPLVVMFGLGVLQQKNSSQIVTALANLALLLGGAVLPLRGQNNAQGASDMGLAHGMLPGYAPITDSASRFKWESAWECRLPSEPGLSAVETLRGCQDGKIAALLVFGENIALSAPSTDASIGALSKAKFMAVADLYMTETAQMAHVVFPACSFLEKDGTFTNIEGRVQRVRKVCEPVGESKTDLQIISDLAKAMGHDLPADPAEVAREIAQHVPGYAGMSYPALDESWGGRVQTAVSSPRLAPLSVVGQEAPDRYLFRLIASRVHFHQQTGTMSRRSPILAREYPEPFAEINESDAEELGLRPGSLVRVFSSAGSITRRLALSADVPQGSVHVPHFFAGDSPNALASYDCDPASGVPIYKGFSVEVEAVE